MIMSGLKQGAYVLQLRGLVAVESGLHFDDLNTNTDCYRCSNSFQRARTTDFAKPRHGCYLPAPPEGSDHTVLSYSLHMFPLQHARQERVEVRASLVRQARTHLEALWPLASSAPAPHCQPASCGSASAPQEAASLCLQLMGLHAQLGCCQEPARRAPALEPTSVSVLLSGYRVCCRLYSCMAGSSSRIGSTNSLPAQVPTHAVYAACCSL
jgi:hypothetical protein